MAKSGWCVKLTTHDRLILRLRLIGAINIYVSNMVLIRRRILCLLMLVPNINTQLHTTKNTVAQWPCTTRDEYGIQYFGNGIFKRTIVLKKVDQIRNGEYIQRSTD